MDLPKIILAPTDFSLCAEHALGYAANLARRLDAQLHVMHAWTYPVSNWEGAFVLPDELITQYERALKAELDRTVQLLRVTLPATTGTLLKGDPRDKILELARQLPADLIAIGTHGRRGLSRLLLGSVAASVVQLAPCSVLTIRERG